jgi:tetratricopeptide (TPR) repeat protein
MPTNNSRELELFVSDDTQTWNALLVLAGAASLTDDLARELITVAGYSREWGVALVGATHACDFAVERNSEWHLAPRVRDRLIAQLTADQTLSERVHSSLLGIADAVAHSKFDGAVPRYLASEVGRAYHGAFLASSVALRAYSRIAEEPKSGEQWLAGQLAEEQIRLGAIAPTAIEVMFLIGMISYRERDIPRAEAVLRRVAMSDEPRREVAVAAHLVGRLDGRRPRSRERAEQLLRKSLSMLTDLGDGFGVAQVLHTLAQVVGRDRQRSEEAEELLRRSLAMLGEFGDTFGEAQVLHTLGQLVGQQKGRSREAEELLRRSLAIGEEIEHEDHEGRALHSLAQLVGRDKGRREEAEILLRRGLATREHLSDKFGEAQILHTLGQLIGRQRGRSQEAEELLRRSLAIGEELRNGNHQAQVLYTMSQVVGRDLSDARELLRSSLEINRRIGNEQGEAIVLRALDRLERTVDQ